MSKENESTSITIGEETWDAERITTLNDKMTAANEAATVSKDALEATKDVNEIGVWVKKAIEDGSKGDMEGIGSIRAFLDKNYPTQTKDTAMEAVELPDGATDTEKVLAKRLNDISANLSERDTNLTNNLQGIINEAFGVIKQDSAASKAVALVKTELGIDATQEEISQAMKAEGVDDPVKAMKLHRWDDAIKAGSKVTGKKPNMVNDTTGVPADFGKMTPEQRNALTNDQKEAWLEKQRLSRNRIAIDGD